MRRRKVSKSPQWLTKTPARPTRRLLPLRINLSVKGSLGKVQMSLHDAQIRAFICEEPPKNAILN
jgi:hypothetical protein